MHKIRVNASIQYDVLIGTGILDCAGEVTRQIFTPRKVAIITDDAVDELYGKRLFTAFEQSGFHPHKYVFANGEHAKSAGTLFEILEFLAAGQFTRSDLLVSLGGGVPGDITGFAAAVYLRGVPFIQIPTTLLAAIDSSVGGKTGINLRAGKNLAGAFHQPSLVLCDCAVLSTLPGDVFRGGVAEALKYGMIGDRDLFDRIKGGGIEKDFERVISRCVSIKRGIVERDEFDRGERQLLNLGHTVGHAIEACSGFDIPHGIAVGIGLAYIARAAEAMDLCSSPVADETEKALSAYGLPVACSFSAKELAHAALRDKKRNGDRLTLVIPTKIGQSRLHEISTNELLDLIRAGEKK